MTDRTPAASANVPMGPGREFDLIRALAARWGDRARGIGDDAAVVDVPPGSRLVASTDTSVEDVHFRRHWLTPREIGYRACAAALSDLAAMAAAPLGMLVALTVSPQWLLHAESLADGMGDAAVAAQCPIVGGDVTAGDRLSLTVTVLGHASRPVGRRGARPGDAVFVTGRLGGPGAALAALRAGQVPSPLHRERFARPVPRIGEARWLAERGATAMIDISDGLSSELRHLAAASAVALDIDLDAVLVLDDVLPTDAAVSGEEYELLCTAPPDIDRAAFARTFGIPLTLVGAVAADGGPEVRVTQGGRRVDLPGGYDQLSR